MDGSRFDDLTRGMARGMTRRAMLLGLAGSLIGAAGVAATAPALMPSVRAVRVALSPAGGSA